MRTVRRGSYIEADIHGMTVDEARSALIRLLDRMDKNVAEIHVIHGYRSGNALKNMVQNNLNHPKILYKCQSLVNEGETKIYIKKQ